MDRRYDDVRFGFAFAIPCGWHEVKLPRSFTSEDAAGAGRLILKPADEAELPQISFVVGRALIADQTERSRRLRAWVVGAGFTFESDSIGGFTAVGAEQNTCVAHYEMPAEEGGPDGVKVSVVCDGVEITVTFNGDVNTHWNALEEVLQSFCCGSRLAEGWPPRGRLRIKPVIDMPGPNPSLGYAFAWAIRLLPKPSNPQSIDLFKRGGDAEDVSGTPGYFFARVFARKTLGERAEKAIRLYKEALRHEPGCAKIHMAIGIALARVKRPGEALEHFREANRLVPDNVWVEGNLARCSFELGRKDDAAYWLKRAENRSQAI